MPRTDRTLDEITDLVADARDIDWPKVKKRLRTAVTRDQSGSVIPDGYKTSSLGGGPGGEDIERLTPVEAAVDARLFAGTPGVLQVGDFHHDQTCAALDALRALVKAANTLDAALDRIDDSLDQTRHPHRESTCCEPHCEDPAAPGRRGRCEPCARWLTRWAEGHASSVSQAPPVPATVIDDRVALRERRKVHITGPEASFT